MRPKEKPIKAGNEISARILAAIFEKQKDYTLYALSKKNDLYPGTFRRTLEAPNAWVQAKLLYSLSQQTGKSLEFIITGKQTDLDKAKEVNKEIAQWKEKYEEERRLRLLCEKKIENIKNTI